MLEEGIRKAVHLFLNESHFSEALIFFFYDSIKIILLLFFMIWIIGFFRSYISQKTMKKVLGKKNFGLSNLFASLFGAVTPFCSCSSIPIFLSFIKGGVPMGVSFSFLITSPLVNEYLLVLMFSFFGLKVTLIYALIGIFLGVFAGIILERMGLEKYIVDDMKMSLKEKSFQNVRDRIKYGLNESVDIVKKLWYWIIVGVGIGALIHNFVPREFVEGLIAKGGIFSIPLVTLLGIPMYANCAAIVPIAVVLFQKGFPLGAALAFMMATSALSLPEAIILRRAMKLQLILIFFGIIGFGIMLIGYALNFV